jgi:hypothetical protein
LSGTRGEERKLRFGILWAEYGSSGEGDSSAESVGHCELCERPYEAEDLSSHVYVWVFTDGGPDTICARCVRHFSERARSEGLDVPWADLYERCLEARERYPEPAYPTAAEFERAEREGEFDTVWELCYLWDSERSLGLMR